MGFLRDNVKGYKVGRDDVPVPAVWVNRRGRHYVDAITLYPKSRFHR